MFLEIIAKLFQTLLQQRTSLFKSIHVNIEKYT